MVNDLRLIFLRRHVRHANGSNSGDGRHGDDRRRRRCRRRSFHHHRRFHRVLPVQGHFRARLRALDQHCRAVDHVLDAVVLRRAEDRIDMRKIAWTMFRNVTILTTAQALHGCNRGDPLRKLRRDRSNVMRGIVEPV